MLIIPCRSVVFVQTWVAPWLGESRPVRRTNRVLPEQRPSAAETLSLIDEAISTARTPRTRTRPSARRAGSSVATDTPTPETPSDAEPERQNGSGIVRQWVTELTGAARPSSTAQGTVRVPSDEEIQILTGMFPDVARDVVLGVLQRRYVISFALPKLSLLYVFSFGLILEAWSSCSDRDHRAHISFHAWVSISFQIPAVDRHSAYDQSVLLCSPNIEAAAETLLTSQRS